MLKHDAEWRRGQFNFQEHARQRGVARRDTARRGAARVPSSVPWKWGEVNIRLNVKQTQRHLQDNFPLHAVLVAFDNATLRGN